MAKHPLPPLVVLLLLLATFVLPAGSAQGAAAGAGPVMYPNGIGADFGPTPVTAGMAIRGGDNASG